MPVTKDFIRQTLSAVRLPGAEQNLVDSGALRWVSYCDGFASIRLFTPQISEAKARRGLSAGCFQALKARSEGEGEPIGQLTVEFVDGAGEVLETVTLGGIDRATERRNDEGKEATESGSGATSGHTPIGGLDQSSSGLAGVRHVIAVGAGKGGVGKSMVAVNLAVGLARKGHAVGLMDGDIYGPSLPTMLRLDALEQNVLQGKLQPYLVHGIKAITIGKLVDPEKPLIWRGPMAHGAFKQLTEQTSWGELDYLVIDLPPGTGDVPLTMAQTLKLTGAVIVCTPQKVAQDDAARAVRMFQQLKVEVLGVIENMSFFVGDDGKVYDIFGRGGAQQMAQRMNLPFLGQIPITTSLRENSDAGDPSANFAEGEGHGDGPDSRGALARALGEVVSNVEKQVALAGIRQGHDRPTLRVS